MASLFSYVIARDYGFAPNPFFGICTLATCMHTVRGRAEVGDWVVGTGSARYGLKGHIVYAMRVDEVLSFDGYWEDARFAIKRPNLRGSLKQIYGDNIYHHDPHGKWLQEDSHHSLAGGKPSRANVKHDTQADRVLVSRYFAYWGNAARQLPTRLGAIVCPRRNYVRPHAPMPERFEAWFASLGELGCLGEPTEFRRHRLLR